MLRYSTFLISLLLTSLILDGCSQQDEQLTMESQTALSSESSVQQYQGLVVEASCGQCQFDLPGSGCDLAVRIDGESYFVDGTDIDDHGDAHASDGFCEEVRQARVSGGVQDRRFTATHFELLPDKSE